MAIGRQDRVCMALDKTINTLAVVVSAVAVSHLGSYKSTNVVTDPLKKNWCRLPCGPLASPHCPSPSSSSTWSPQAQPITVKVSLVQCSHWISRNWQANNSWKHSAFPRGIERIWLDNDKCSPTRQPFARKYVIKRRAEERSERTDFVSLGLWQKTSESSRSWPVPSL